MFLKIIRVFESLRGRMFHSNRQMINSPTNMSTIQGRNYQISARVIGKMSVGELIAKMCTIKGHHTQQDIWSLPARSQTPRPLPGKIKPWTYFTSDSDTTFSTFIQQLSRQRTNELFQMSVLQRLPYLLVRIHIKWIKVHAQRSREQDRILRIRDEIDEQQAELEVFNKELIDTAYTRQIHITQQGRI